MTQIKKPPTKLGEQDIDHLMSDGFTSVPQQFSRNIMARIESETLAVSVPLYVQLMRAFVLLAGVGIGLSQALRFMFGVYFLGVLN